MSKHFTIIAGFGLLLVLLTANAYNTRRQIENQIRKQALIAHTLQVISTLNQTESLLKDAESDQRGFLLTAEPKYLGTYEESITQIQPHIEFLARLTKDNPLQQARIPALRDLSRTRMVQLAQTISLAQAGRTEEARRFVLSDVGRSTMVEIRSLVAQMEQEESSLEDDRIADLKRTTQGTNESMYLSTAIAASGLTLLAFFILREMKLRETFSKQIRIREELFRVTLTSIGDAVIATDQHSNVTFLNPVAEKLIGTRLENARGKNIVDVFPIFEESTQQVVENPVRKVLELGHQVDLANHTVLQRSDGTLIPIEDSAAPIRDDLGQVVGVVLVFRDVTVGRKAADVLRKTERLASAARLSASVAHEINNPLEAVVSLVYLAKISVGATPFMIEQLGMAERELERVAHITRQTLGFYRESQEPESTNVASLIESVLKLYSNKLLTKNISIERDFAECPHIRAIKGELHQVVSNLISNAVDAVGPNGVIFLHTHSLEENGNSVVQIVVEDDGPGIAAEHVDLIFEPFFTTKQEVGTGLGLWVTREIVERHGGRIQVHSGKRGLHGASFTVLLPIQTKIQVHSHAGISLTSLAIANQIIPSEAFTRPALPETACRS